MSETGAMVQGRIMTRHNVPSHGLLLLVKRGTTNLPRGHDLLLPVMRRTTNLPQGHDLLLPERRGTTNLPQGPLVLRERVGVQMIEVRQDLLPTVLADSGSVVVLGLSESNRTSHCDIVSLKNSSSTCFQAVNLV